MDMPAWTGSGNGAETTTWQLFRITQYAAMSAFHAHQLPAINTSAALHGAASAGP
jgi:hypothetical protein